MTSIFSRAGVIVLLFLVISSCDRAPSTTDIYPQSPDWTAKTLAGNDIQLYEIAKERPQILLFWATWCPYCKALMPHLQSILLEHAGEFDVLALSYREDGDPVKYVESASFDFTLILAGDSVAELYGIEGTPGLILIDTTGQIRFDRRDLADLALSADGKKLSHSQAARRLAPYWAAELRKALDSLN